MEMEPLEVTDLECASIEHMRKYQTYMINYYCNYSSWF